MCGRKHWPPISCISDLKHEKFGLYPTAFVNSSSPSSPCVDTPSSPQPGWWRRASPRPKFLRLRLNPASEGDVAEKWLDYIVFTRVPVVGHALLQRQLYVAEVIASHLQLVPQVQLVHTSAT